MEALRAVALCCLFCSRLCVCWGCCPREGGTGILWAREAVPCGEAAKGCGYVYFVLKKNQAATQRTNLQASGKQPCACEESTDQKTSRFCFTVSTGNWHISSLPQFILQEVDITLPENSAWYDKYKYDIPVFHLNGKFLMKHRVDIPKFEDRLRKLELQNEGNQWRKRSCSEAGLKGEKNFVEKKPKNPKPKTTHIHSSGLKFLRTYECEKLEWLVFCFVLITQPSCTRSHLFCAVHLLLSWAGVFSPRE